MGAGAHLVRALQALLQGEADQVLDALRRVGRSIEDAPASERAELGLVRHLLATFAFAHTGERDRAVREAFKARTLLPPRAAPRLRHLLMRQGAIMLAAEDRLLEAERWVLELEQSMHPHTRESTGADAEPGDAKPEREPAPPDPDAVLLLARIMAARGDRGALDAVERPRAGSSRPDSSPGRELAIDPDEVGVRVGLVIGEPERTRDQALQWLQAAPSDPVRLRLWALAQARTWDGPVEPGQARGVIEALRTAERTAPRRLRPAFSQELACVALRADALEPAWLEPELALGRADDAAPELRLLWIRARLRAGEDVSAAFEAGPPVHLPATPDLQTPLGPDEVSPLRDPRRRGLQAQRSLTLAEYCLKTGRREQAETALVDALVEMPDLARAAQLLRSLSPQPTSTRLEATLASATELLAAVPASVLGVPLAQIPGALSGVIAARERLARPLTIAIMGEFSSGKSTFVNALLGEDVAPMGALPTTSTINVFRQGAAGRARVHYRDDHIATVERDQVRPFLHGLDATEASRIRYVEIERAGTRLGDAAVVDTPGLNALDAFHERVAREFIEEADAVVWIFSATRGGAASEASMLAELREGGRQVLGVLNKADTLEPAEQRELATYLQEQLGDVLVGVVPTSATRALQWRTSSARDGRDPFTDVDEALERSFLVRARELKRALTARRLREALALARADVEAAIEALEARADAPSRRDDPLVAAEALQSLAEQVHAALLDLDDLLVRECLALGVLSVERGGSLRPLDGQDAAYLDAVLEEAVLRVLAARVGQVPAELGPTLPSLVVAQFMPWARGYMAARTRSRLDFDLDGGADPAGPSLMAQLHRHARAHAGSGEAGLRAGFRDGLRRLADDFRRQLRALHRELEWTTFFARQRRSSAPRAQALRLRVAVLAGIDALGARARADRGDRQSDPAE
jgi:GTPase SAR1 family protein